MFTSEMALYLYLGGIHRNHYKTSFTFNANG